MRIWFYWWAKLRERVIDIAAILVSGEDFYDFLPLEIRAEIPANLI